jgi:hypothetical protein
VLVVGTQVLQRAGELSSEDRFARRQRTEHVALEDVVQPLALGQDPQTALQRRFRQPSHRSASIALTA